MFIPLFEQLQIFSSNVKIFFFKKKEKKAFFFFTQSYFTKKRKNYEIAKFSQIYFTKKRKKLQNCKIFTNLFYEIKHFCKKRKSKLLKFFANPL